MGTIRQLNKLKTIGEFGITLEECGQSRDLASNQLLAASDRGAGLAVKALFVDGEA